mmetsp:Transcript_18691/g.60046  ORF Transcript_18691/g.60046 Transcript_18691/m.60046 type:complete len:468 (+) Transcript_18691:425-1828(+)
MRPLPADARRRPPRHVALPRPSRPLLLRRRLCFRRRTSARASCLRSAAGEARLRADAAGRNCARTHLFRRQLARCPHPTLCGGGILHGRRGGAASRTRRAGGGVGVPRGRRLVRDHVAVDGHAFPVRPLQAALPRLRLPRGASPRGRYQGEAAAKVRQRRRGARAVSRRHGAGAAAFGRMRARLQVELARRRAHRAVLARCRRPAHVGSVLSLGEPADHPGKGQAAPRVGRGWAYFATRLLSPRGPGVAVAPRGDERRAARWHVLRFRPSRPPAVCRARREQPRHSLSRPRLFRFPLLVLALGRRPVRRAAGDRVRGGRRGERYAGGDCREVAGRVDAGSRDPARFGELYGGRTATVRLRCGSCGGGGGGGGGVASSPSPLTLCSSAPERGGCSLPSRLPSHPRCALAASGSAASASTSAGAGKADVVVDGVATRRSRGRHAVRTPPPARLSHVRGSFWPEDRRFAI